MDVPRAQKIQGVTTFLSTFIGKFIKSKKERECKK
jgi:hypothetical protein